MIDLQYIRAATVLLRWGTLSILTDPWFAMQLRGLPVFVRPRPGAEELPPLDVVLVSHFHPDHFDRGALARLIHPIRLLLGPPGIVRRARGLPVQETMELADGEMHTREGVDVRAHAVYHSGYENAYILERDGATLFFAGDARYSDVFRAIGEQHRPLVSLLPVGGTIVLGHRIVMGPREAYRAALDLGTRVVVPIHPGGEWLSVPPLSLHPGRARHLVDLARKNGAPFSVAALAPGERITIRADGTLGEVNVFTGRGRG